MVPPLWNIEDCSEPWARHGKITAGNGTRISWTPSLFCARLHQASLSHIQSQVFWTVFHAPIVFPDFSPLLHCQGPGLYMRTTAAWASGARRRVSFKGSVSAVSAVSLARANQTQSLIFLSLCRFNNRPTWNKVTVGANIGTELKGTPTEMECLNGSGLIVLSISSQHMWPSFS